MKIFVNYRNFEPINDGLKARGFEVIENEWDPDVCDLSDCAGYLICMYNGIKRPWQFYKLHAKLRRYGVPLIVWNRDGPWNKGEKAWRLWMLRHIDYIDIYATHTLQRKERFAPLTLYLPNAAWTKNYHLAGATLEQLRRTENYKFDVSFFGRLDPIKYPEMSDRASFFNELENKLRRYNVSCCFKHSEGMTYSEQIEFVQASRINMNFWAGCDDGPEKSWGLPERCYGIPACGGFLLSDYRHHAADDFIVGREWVHFENLDDAIAKIRYHLERFDETRRIAEAAHARVMKDHTYANRAGTLIESAKAWQRERGGK